MQPFAPL